MKHINWYGGLLLLVLFAITGHYLRGVTIPADQNEDLFRMMLRANHIYILFVGLVNIMVSRSSFDKLIFQNLTQSFFVMSGVFVVFAFILETDGDIEHRMFSFLTGISALSGIICFVLDVWIPKLQNTF